MNSVSNSPKGIRHHVNKRSNVAWQQLKQIRRNAKLGLCTVLLASSILASSCSSDSPEVKKAKLLTEQEKLDLEQQKLELEKAKNNENYVVTEDEIKKDQEKLNEEKKELQEEAKDEKISLDNTKGGEQKPSSFNRLK